MTITYSLEVSSAKIFAFTKLLIRWRGSIYKLMKQELLVFVTLYYAILSTYRWILKGQQRRNFTDICLYFRAYLDYVPMTFVLGFYVTLVANRWWNIYMNLPWVDRTCSLVGAYVHGNDERGRLMRRTLARYVNLMNVLCLRCVSPQVKRRFPTLGHLVDGKLMTESERAAIESTNRFYGEYFVPSLWFGNLVGQARREGRITDDIYVKQLMDNIANIRSWNGMLLSYDWMSIPLVYTQVVIIATYTFFFGCLLGRQYLDEADKTYWISKYLPLFTFIQFFFYMGWLKVAEVLLNPLGEDDDDFEVNYLIDRNVCIGFLMVDDWYGKYPLLERDAYWGDIDPLVPYTAAAAGTYIEPYLGSAVNFDVPVSVQEWVAEGNQAESKPGSAWFTAARHLSRQVSQLTETSNAGIKPSRRRCRKGRPHVMSSPYSRQSSQPDTVSMSSVATNQSFSSEDTKSGSVDVRCFEVPADTLKGSSGQTSLSSQQSTPTLAERGATHSDRLDPLAVLEEVNEESFESLSGKVLHHAGKNDNRQTTTNCNGGSTAQSTAAEGTIGQ